MLPDPWTAVTTCVPFWVMALTGSWWWPIGACCTMVKVCIGLDLDVWRMWLIPPIEVVVIAGTGSTFTEKNLKPVLKISSSLWHRWNSYEIVNVHPNVQIVTPNLFTVIHRLDMHYPAHYMVTCHISKELDVEYWFEFNSNSGFWPNKDTWARNSI